MKNNVKTLKAHFSLNVKNVENSIEFYKKLFGIEPAKVRSGYAKFDVENPPLNLALNENNFTERGALSHLGIQVATTEDVLEIKRQWENIGLLTKDEMQTSCCYALQDKSWVSDPDGNGWEVFTVLEDNLPETNMCCVSNEAENVSEKTLQNLDAECCVSTAVPISINEKVKNSCC